jgi:copper(I)-binding protein
LIGNEAGVPRSGHRTLRITSLALLIAIVIAGCGTSTEGVEITDVRLGRPTGPNAALYFRASGPEDRLVGASTPAAAGVQIHQTTENDDGTMGMEHLDSLELPDGGDLVLEPGGYHLMLIEVDRLEVGESIELTLVWEKEGEMTLEAEVVSPADAVTDG